MADGMIAGGAAALAARAGQVAEAAAAAAAWAQSRAGGTEAMGRKLRAFARRAARLRAAAERPMAVAVFGASQAGKSYLVNGLATPPGKRLTAAYGSERLDFMTQINPEGDKEATGLVSRFTVRPQAAPGDLPVPLRLLSQTDVVKILANTFMEDFSPEGFVPPEAEAVQALLAGLEGRAAPQAAGGLSLDDVEELQEYFRDTLGSKPMVRALTDAGYWAKAVALLPRLPPELLAEGFSPLWNRTGALTRAADELFRALSRLGHAAEAYTGTEALFPREPGILNVDTLFGLGQPGTALLRVATPDGRRLELPRPVVAALTAELVVPLAEQPWDFFSHTDLLDFPGARTREDISDADAFLAKPHGLGSAFIRGKVAYLYQRYNAEQEITSMLLCVGPSNNEVQTLPRMIRTWIDQTVGDTPEKRARQRNPLFLVLTKFDMQFAEKEGADIVSGQAWSARLDASLLNFFGKDSEWPRQWVPGQPFSNAQWLRSTAMKFRDVMEYGPPGEDGREPEIGIAPHAVARTAQLKDAYLRNEKVRAHIADPGRAWDEALRANDGGIAYLAARLRPMCDPALKQEQIAGRLEDLASAMAAQLRPYWRADTGEEALAQARERARTVLRALVACAQAQMFGPLLRALQLGTEEVAGVYWRAQSEPDGAARLIGAASAAEDYLADFEDLLEDDTLPGPASGPATRAPAVRDRWDRLTDLALQHWTGRMQDLAGSPDLEAAYAMPGEQAAILVAELAAAARRTGLRERIAAALRARASFAGRGAAAAQKPILLIETLVNGFVHQLGYADVPPERRPRAAKGERAIFAPRPPVGGLPRLQPQPAPYDRAFHVDWMTALRQVVEDNVGVPADDGADAAANAALGRVLAKLERRAQGKAEGEARGQAA